MDTTDKTFNSYMHTTGDQFGRPINGQREISGYQTIESGNEWKAMVSTKTKNFYLSKDF